MQFLHSREVAFSWKFDAIFPPTLCLSTSNNSQFTPHPTQLTCKIALWSAIHNVNCNHNKPHTFSPNSTIQLKCYVCIAFNMQFHVEISTLIIILLSSQFNYFWDWMKFPSSLSLFSLCCRIYPDSEWYEIQISLPTSANTGSDCARTLTCGCGATISLSANAEALVSHRKACHLI